MAVWLEVFIQFLILFGWSLRETTKPNVAVGAVLYQLIGMVSNWYSFEKFSFKNN